jgi:phenylacetate-CoA ligase
MALISKVMQKITMSTPERGRWFLSSMKPTFFEKKGINQAIEVFHEVRKRVPAYKKFLEERNFRTRKVKNLNVFSTIPITDKKNYITKFPLENRCLDGNLHHMYALSTSSGATGIPTYWPRIAETDKIIPKAVDLLLKDIVNPKENSVLVIVTLSMGLWSAGDLAARALRDLSAKKEYKMTTVTPGLRIDDTIRLVKDIGSKYDCIILVGYPPFIKDIVEIGERKGINWKKLSTKIMMGGEGISEHWRDYILAKIGSKRIFDVCNLFATSDSGIIAFETPFSIIVRRLVENNKGLKKILFENNETVAVTQYNPMAKYLETNKGEIVLTSAGGVPLVRYNLHDRGRIIPYQEVLKVLENNGVTIEKEMKRSGYKFKEVMKLPLFAAYGRSDAVHFYAVNIYGENIMSALDDKSLASFVTGRFKVGVEEDKKMNQTLKIKVELKSNKKQTSSLQKKIQETIHNKLCQLNSEYNELNLYLTSKRKRNYLPEVELFTYKDSRYFGGFKIKHKYTL